ncbi:UDP-glucose 4-epimerase GalE [bacterium]|nr:UDP-glucose 4-epimerase GalE [bacterium]
MKSILVIGGAGYIGSHVVLSFLNAGFDVTVLDNLSSGRQINLFEKAHFIHADIMDRMALDDVFKKPYDGVIHLAALKAAGESMIIPEKYAYQNINGAVNLLEALSNSRTKIVIFSSTAAVYGMPQQLPLTEDHPLDPINFYGFTKLEIERLFDWFYRLKGIHFASLRYFNAAGYDPDGNIKGLERNPANLIPIVMEAAIGRRDKVEVYGNDYPTPDGTGVRDYVHVSDLADGHLKAFQYVLRERKPLTVNLGTGKGCSVMEVIKMTEQVSGKKVPHSIVGRRPGDPADLYAHSKKANELLKWKPQFSDLKTIISSTWEVYKNR